MASEFIDRLEAARFLLKCSYADSQPRAIRRAARVVANFPAADAEKVVRCGECRYWENDEEICGHICTCGGLPIMTTERNFYCAYGKKEGVGR